MKTNNLFLSLWLLFSMAAAAQEYKELPDNYYLQFPEKNPYDLIAIFAYQDGKALPQKLSKGFYKVNRNDVIGNSAAYFEMDALNKVNGTIRIIDPVGKDSIFAVTIDGKLSSLEYFKDRDIKSFVQFKDSILTSKKFENGKIARQEIQYFTKKNFEKSVETVFYQDGHYIRDEIENTTSEFFANGKIKSFENKATGEVKAYTEKAQMANHFYKKGGTYYEDYFENGKLVHRSYAKEGITHKEEYKNGRLFEKTVSKEIDGGVEVSKYDAKGKLLEKYNAFNPSIQMN